MDRSDTSFMCFELSVDYVSAVQSYYVLAGTDWKVGVALGRLEEREKSRGRKEAPCYPIRDEPPLCRVSAYTHTQRHRFVHTRTHTLQTDVNSQQRDVLL